MGGNSVRPTTTGKGEPKTEGRGFEPLRPCGLPVFKTGAINQTPPPLRVPRSPHRPDQRGTSPAL